MKKKEELKFLNKDWKGMNAHLKVFLETGDQEALHKFRVQIKKLKALLILFERTSKQHGIIKYFKPIKKIFKRAGQIRDAYINLQLSERYELKNEVFKTDQQKIIEEGTNEFRHYSKKIITNIKNTHKELKKQLPHINNDLVTGYYKKQLEQIAVNLAVPEFTEDMHTNRKLIKILIYNYKLTDKVINKSLNLNIEYLNKLQDNIGKWHDNIIAEKLFSQDLNDKQIASKIKKINTNVKRRILSIADDFLKKATTIEMAVT